MTMGKIICTGLGPGDPDLMAVRSDRLIRAAAHVAYFRKKGRKGQARRIVDGMLAAGVTEYAMEYPVTTELPFDSPEYIDALARFYDDWADRLATVAQTAEVVVLCEGDPFFYGSFMHLYTRLRERITVEVIPGITGMSGCWTATGTPIINPVAGDDQINAAEKTAGVAVSGTATAGSTVTVTWGSATQTATATGGTASAPRCCWPTGCRRCRRAARRGARLR